MSALIALGWVAGVTFGALCLRGICRAEAPPNPTPEQQQHNRDTLESWWTT